MKSFEELISKARGAVDVIGEKAGQFVDVSKLNLKVMDTKSQIRSEFESLGRLVYENFGEELENKDEVKSQVDYIKELYTQLEKYKTQIAFMKNKILCKSCGNHNEVGSLYCAKCGANLKQDGQPIIPEDSLENDDFAEFDD